MRVHAAGGDVRYLRRGHPRRGPPGTDQPVSQQHEQRARAHVQRRVCAREPPPGRRLQDTAVPRVRHLCQPHQEAAPDGQEDGH